MKYQNWKHLHAGCESKGGLTRKLPPRRLLDRNRMPRPATRGGNWKLLRLLLKDSAFYRSEIGLEDSWKFGVILKSL